MVVRIPARTWSASHSLHSRRAIVRARRDDAFAASEHAHDAKLVMPPSLRVEVRAPSPALADQNRNKAVYGPTALRVTGSPILTRTGQS
jgi:hypothetical protein